MRVARTLRLAAATSILAIAGGVWLAPAVALDPACRERPTSACVLQAAEQTAQRLSPDIRAEAFDILAMANVRLNRLDGAIEASRRSIRRDEILITIAMERADAGRFNEALQIARHIREPEGLVQTLLLIARRAIKTGQGDLVRRIADEAGQAQTRMEHSPRSVGAKAEVLVWQGRLDEALELARAEADPVDGSVVLTWVVNALTAAGRIEEAARIAGQITEPLGRLTTLRFAAEALARAGQDSRADRLFEEAWQLTATVDDMEERVAAQVGIVTALATAGRLDRAAALAGMMDHPLDRGRMLAEIGERYMRAGQGAQARRLFQQAADSVAGREAYDRASVIAIVARAGDLDEAERMGAMIGTPRSNDAPARELVTESLARGAAANGRFEQARRFIDAMPAGRRTEVTLDLIAALAQAGARDRTMAMVAQAIDLATAEVSHGPVVCSPARNSCGGRYKDSILAYRLQALAAIADALAKAGL